jgi:hypothetical protein
MWRTEASQVRSCLLRAHADFHILSHLQQQYDFEYIFVASHYMACNYHILKICPVLSCPVLSNCPVLSSIYSLTFVNGCRSRRSWRFLKEKKYLFKYKVSNRNIFIQKYTYLVHQFFAFSLAGLTSWCRPDEAGICFGILYHKYCM